ncbi:MAG: hypothetical protein ACREDF_10560, partial [Thermoplasmata archaeon]
PHFSSSLFRSQVSCSHIMLYSVGGIIVDYADIAVRGSVDNIRNLVTHAFGANEFHVSWESPTKGKAEKGRKGMNIAFGALAQYYAVEFEVFPGPDGAVLRPYQSVSGWWSGMWGA